MYTAGVDLVQKQLNNLTRTSSETTLLQSAIQGKDHIPLEAMAKFVRLAHIYEQKDVLELLAESVIEELQSSSNELVVCRGKALQLMLAMELLEMSYKNYKTSLQRPAVPPSTSKRATSAQRGGKTESDASGSQVTRVGKGESGRSSALQGKRRGEGGGATATPPGKGGGGKKESGGISERGTSKGLAKIGESVAGSPPQDPRPGSVPKKTPSRTESGKEETEKDEEERGEEQG